MESSEGGRVPGAMMRGKAGPGKAGAAGPAGPNGTGSFEVGRGEGRPLQSGS